MGTTGQGSLSDSARRSEMTLQVNKRVNLTREVLGLQSFFLLCPPLRTSDLVLVDPEGYVAEDSA